MRPQLNVQLNPETIDALRGLAEEIGAPLGDLTDTLLRFGLQRADKAALTKWAAALPSRKGRRARIGLRVSDQTVLASLDRIGTAAAGGVVRSAVEIARDGGLLLKVGFDTLQSLKGSGLVAGAVGDEVDRWGRAVESVWWLPARALPGVDQAAILEAVKGIRAELGRMRVEPLAVGLIERAIHRSAGWSIAAMRLPQGEMGDADLLARGALEWLRVRWPLPL